MIKLIDSLSYQNKLRSVSTLWKCGFAAVLFLFSYVSHPVLQLLVGLLMLLWTVRYAGVPLKFYGLLIGAPCLFYAASLPPLLLEVQPAGSLLVSAGESAVYPTMTLFTWAAHTVYISGAGMEQALRLFTRIIGCLSCMTFVMLTTPMSELFQVMKKLRMPALVLELMQIMYRFLFLLTDTAQSMYTAQKARGGQSGFRGGLQDTAMLIVRLFGKTIQRYKDLSHGLVARGFTEEIRMAPYEGKAMPTRYKWESTVSIALLLLIEVWLRWGEHN